MNPCCKFIENIINLNRFAFYPVITILTLSCFLAMRIIECVNTCSVDCVLAIYHPTLSLPVFHFLSFSFFSNLVMYSVYYHDSHFPSYSIYIEIAFMDCLTLKFSPTFFFSPLYRFPF